MNESIRIAVSAGGDEDVPATITETTGKEIDAGSITWALIGDGNQPTAMTTWRTPADAENLTPASVRIMCRINDALGLRGRYEVWIKLLDGGRTVIRPVAGTLVLS